MKTFIVLSLMCLLALSCKTDDRNPTQNNANTNTEPEVAKINLEGAWELVGYYNYVDNVVTDSFYRKEGYRQVKMYTPTKVMWSKKFPSDSSEWFGYGNYKVEGDELIEVLDYGSEMMSKIIDNKKAFNYELQMKDDTFSQIEMDEDGNKVYAENYRRIE